MDRIKTGVAGLDKLLEGGFPTNSSILLIGPPGCGKSTLCQQFVWEGLREKQPAMFITLDVSPEEIRETMKNFSWKVDNMKEKLKFIDAYSWRIGESKEEYSISNLGNVNELNIAISEVIKNLNSSKIKRAVLDSISTLLLYADTNLVLKLIPIIIAKGKANGYTQLLILEEGVHDEKTVSMLNYQTDGMIEFKMEEDNRFMRISRMKGTKVSRDWIKFDVTNKGLVIK